MYIFTFLLKNVVHKNIPSPPVKLPPPWQEYIELQTIGRLGNRFWPNIFNIFYSYYTGYII